MSTKTINWLLATDIFPMLSLSLFFFFVSFLFLHSLKTNTQQPTDLHWKAPRLFPDDLKENEKNETKLATLCHICLLNFSLIRVIGNYTRELDEIKLTFMRPICKTLWLKWKLTLKTQGHWMFDESNQYRDRTNHWI